MPWDYGYLFTRRLVQDLQDILPLPGQNYLDIGAGSQPYRPMYEKGRTVVALDLDRSIPSLQICSPADDLPIRSSSFDVVLLFSVLQCVDNPANVFQEIARVLKPQGHLLISELQSWHCWSQADRYRFTENGLRKLADLAGLSVASFRRQNSFWARVGIRLNRAILPYSSSSFSWMEPLLRPVILLNNLLFGILDRTIQWDGETVNHVMICRKTKDALL